eukprot:sb/3479742/
MDDFLKNVPDDVKEVYKKNWKTIRPSVKKGVLKDMYHFPISPYDNIPGKLGGVLKYYLKPVKVRVAFGYILRNTETDELKFFHPSNNTMVFETAQVIADRDDIMEVKNEIERDDLVEIARESRHSSKWVVETIVCIRFDVYRYS